MTDRARTAIIGAGPAGLTAAYLLSQSGKSVSVHEASPYIGGLSRSFRLWGQIVDIGPHRFFSSDRRINDLWMEVVGEDYEIVHRLTRIYYKNRFFFYPLKPFDALRNMGGKTAIQCVASYLRQRLGPQNRPILTFEDWVTARFGHRLYSIFFKTYSEKLWGIPCSSLDADFAAQRIKKFSLGAAILSAFGTSSEKHKTLVDSFAYPKAGTGSVYESMARSIREAGNQVYLESPIRRVVTEDGRCTGIIDAQNTYKEADWVVSTMPLTLLIKGLSGVPTEVLDAANALRFRNTIIVYLQVGQENLFQDQWLYIHDSRVKFGRVTNFRNWSPNLTQGKRETILALEYWCFDDDDIWNSPDEEIIETAKKEIALLDLCKKADIQDGKVLRVRRSYPVYEMGYRENVAIIRRYLQQIPNLIPIGRYGSFKYNNQDHSILMGILAKEKIDSGSHPDLWSINTDFEDYQEDGSLDQAGYRR